MCSSDLNGQRVAQSQNAGVGGELDRSRLILKDERNAGGSVSSWNSRCESAVNSISGCKDSSALTTLENAKYIV